MESRVEHAPTNRSKRVSRLRRVAALSSLISGFGFGIPGLIGTMHFVKTGEVWHFIGFPTYGGGPFERLGLGTSVPLLSAFVAVCASEIALGTLLWKRWRSAKALSYTLFPIELTFWIGFALPFGPPLGLARVGLIAAAAQDSEESGAPE